MSGGEQSILPTRRELAECFAREASPEGRRAQRESIEVAQRARAAGRGITDQRLHEAKGGR